MGSQTTEGGEGGGGVWDAAGKYSKKEGKKHQPARKVLGAKKGVKGKDNAAKSLLPSSESKEAPHQVEDITKKGKESRVPAEKPGKISNGERVQFRRTSS